MSLRPQQQVVHAVRQWIESGDLKVNDALPSQRDLATSLGVNRRTVKRALDLLSEQGYVRSQGNSSTIVRVEPRDVELLAGAVGLITPFSEELDDEAVDESCLMAITMGLMQGLRRGRCHVIALNSDHLDLEHIRRMIDAGLGGLVMSELNWTSERRAALRSLIREKCLPAAMVGGGPTDIAALRVCSDHREGADMLVEHLAGRGCRRILMIGSEPLSRHWMAERYAGYREGMDRAGLPAREYVEVRDLPWQTKDDADLFWLRVRMFAGYLAEHLSGPQPIDAILAINDPESFVVSAALRFFECEPGRDVLVAGYDNTGPRRFERQLEPAMPVATIDKFNRRLGQEAAALWLKTRDRPDLSPQTRRIKPSLVVLDGQEGQKAHDS